MSGLRTDGVRLAELVASLSYAADLGLGQPMAHCMRQTVIALRLADLAGATDAEREATYYLGLLFNAYCHADAAEQASWFGDDISFKADGFDMLGHDHRPDGGVPPPPRRRARQRSVPGPTTGRLSAVEHQAGHGLPDHALALECAVRRADRPRRGGGPGLPGRLRAVGRQGRAAGAARHGDRASRSAGAGRRPGRGLRAAARPAGDPGGRSSAPGRRLRPGRRRRLLRP